MFAPFIAPNFAAKAIAIDDPYDPEDEFPENWDDTPIDKTPVDVPLPTPVLPPPIPPKEQICYYCKDAIGTSNQSNVPVCPDCTALAKSRRKFGG